MKLRLIVLNVLLLVFGFCKADSLNVAQADTSMLKNNEESYALASANKDTASMAASGLLLGEQYLNEGKAKNAIPLLEQSYIYNKQANHVDEQVKIALLLSKAYEQLKKYPSAYYYLIESVALKDSLEMQKSKLLNELQAQMQAELNSKVQSLKNKDDDLKRANESYERTLQYFLIAVGVLLILVLILLFTAFRIKQKSTKTLKEINALLEVERSKANVEKVSKTENFSPGMLSLISSAKNESDVSLLKKIFPVENVVPIPVEQEIPQTKENILLQETIPAGLAVLEDALKKGNWQQIKSAAHDLQSLLAEAGINDLQHLISEFTTMDGTTPYLAWHQKTKTLVKAVMAKLSFMQMQ